MDVLALRPSDFERLEDAAAFDPDRSADQPSVGKRTVERFLSNTKVGTSDKSLDLMLLIVYHRIQLGPLTDSDNKQLAGFGRLFEDYKKFVNTVDTNEPILSTKELIEERSFEQPSVRRREPADNAHSINLVLSFLGIGRNGSRSAEKVFFRPEDGEKIHFETYRFCSLKGHIQKSFTVLHRADPDMPIVRFGNYYDHSGRIRFSNGILLKFAQQICFIGSADGGASLKSAVFDDVYAPQDKYNGLLLTSEPDGRSIASRVALRRSKFENHADAGTRVLPISEAAKSDGDLINSIRNRIEFSLEEPVMDEAGEKIDQKTMVAIVNALLRKDGQKLLTDENNGLFNPAEDARYTFNAALKIRD